jgi:hypothetical protein
MLDDRAQMVRDLDMYAEHMLRAILGENADHLRPWLSPETLDGLPLVGGALSEYLTDGTDIISFVESAVSKIQEVDEIPDKQFEASSIDATEANELPKE